MVFFKGFKSSIQAPVQTGLDSNHPVAGILLADGTKNCVTGHKHTGHVGERGNKFAVSRPALRIP